MERPKCAVKKCENGAMVMYGNQWICGECLMKIMGKETDRKNKQIEDLEIDD